ncbi:MAG: hypothetical protein IJW77_16635 [Clostridia bacterium]|nr:hypothetical protein [Clostridia bacterium]
MKLIGLQNGMVLQRNAEQQCDSIFWVDKIGEISVSAVNNIGLPSPVSAVVLGEENGYRRVSLSGLHTGGPHTLTLKIGETSVTICDLYVGDVWLLGGQSNMDGAGVYRDAISEYQIHNEIRFLTVTGQWYSATHPLHQNFAASESMILKHLGLNEPQASSFSPRCVGPGYDFACEMLKRTGVPQGLIPCALGGSCLNQWDPDASDAEVMNLYHIALRKCRENGGSIRGLFWYQGCSEGNPADSERFSERMCRMIHRLRSDLNNEVLPVVQVQIGSFVWADAVTDITWSSIREQQRTLSGKIPFLDTVAVTNAVLADGIHLSAETQKHLGKHAAEAMFHLCFDPYGTESRAAPVLEDIRIVSSYEAFNGILAVRFKNLHGSLCAQGRASGFSFHDRKDYSDLRRIIRVDLYDDTAYIHHLLSEDELRSCYLFYCFGNQAYANITDAEGRPIPAFGPICII